MANGVAGTGVGCVGNDLESAGLGGSQIGQAAGVGTEFPPTFEELQDAARKLDGNRYVKVHTSGPAMIEIKGNQLIVTQGSQSDVTYLD